MEIYISKEKCTGCGACKAACPKRSRVYFKRKRRKKSCVLKSRSHHLHGRMCVTVCMEDEITLEN